MILESINLSPIYLFWKWKIQKPVFLAANFLEVIKTRHRGFYIVYYSWHLWGLSRLRSKNLSIGKTLERWEINWPPWYNLVKTVIHQTIKLYDIYHHLPACYVINKVLVFWCYKPTRLIKLFVNPLRVNVRRRVHSSYKFVNIKRQNDITMLISVTHISRAKCCEVIFRLTPCVRVICRRLFREPRTFK